jgi:hypothetical protein
MQKSESGTGKPESESSEEIKALREVIYGNIAKNSPKVQQYPKNL